MTRLRSLRHHHGDKTGELFPIRNCLNCGQQLLVLSPDGNEASIGAGVVEFTSFVKNKKTQVFMRNALKEIYSILHVIEEPDLENCALCVDCSLVFAQLFGLFQTFESRRKSEGFLDVALTKGLEQASEFTRNKTGDENDGAAENDFSCEFGTFAYGSAADADDSDHMGFQCNVEINEHASNDDGLVRSEVVSSLEHSIKEERHHTDDCDEVILGFDSENNDHGSPRTSHEIGTSAEESDEESSKVASRSAIISKANSHRATRRAKSIASYSQDSVKRPRKSARIKGEGQSAKNVNVCETNVTVETLPGSDDVPTSDDSDSDDDGPSKTQQNIIYKCADCAEELPFPSVLARHRKSIHGSSELYKCHICLSNFQHGPSLTTHLRRHEKIKLSETKTYTEAEKIYKCIDCDDGFPDVSQLRRHRVDTHGADGVNQHVLICHICRYSTNHTASFKFHFVRHVSTEVHKCSQCRKSFNLFRKLQVHMKTKHRIMLLRNHNHPLDPSCDKIILRCRKCEAEFDCEERLLEHSKAEHGDGTFRCDICYSSFLIENTFRRHMLEHGKSNFKCRFCDKKYKSRSSRKIHEQNAHLASGTNSRHKRSETSTSDTADATK